MSTRGRKFPAEVLTRSETLALLEGCAQERLPERARALLVVLWRGGLRISEALALKPVDVDFRCSMLHVREGKGRKPRSVALDRRAFEILDTWRSHRTTWMTLSLRPQEPPFFCTRHSTRVSSDWCRVLIRRLAKRAGILRRIHPHAFRHTYAMHAMEDGVPLHVVKAQLGHKNLATTNTYLDHVTVDELTQHALNRKW